MSKTKSLKYLILDTINKFKNNNNSELINKIQNSLNVEDHNTNYKITWKNNNINTYIIPKEDFKFYERNDMINYENNSNYLEINNKSAEKLIEKILKSKEKKQEKLYPLKLISFFYISSIFIFFFTLYFVKQDNTSFWSMIICSLFFLDLSKINLNFLLPLILLFIVNFYQNSIIILFSILLLLFIILDSDFRYKKTRIFIQIVSLVILFNNTKISYPEVTTELIIICCLVLIAYLKIFFYNNYRCIWLYCLPTISLGYAFNKDFLLSIISVIFIFFLPNIYSLISNLINKKFNFFLRY
jgi:hypothetical protein